MANGGEQAGRPARSAEGPGRQQALPKANHREKLPGQAAPPPRQSVGHQPVLALEAHAAQDLRDPAPTR
jgi:hypothetical protein